MVARLLIAAALSFFASCVHAQFASPSTRRGRTSDAYTYLLMHMDGDSGATTFLDVSNDGASNLVTTYGDANVNVTTKKFGTGSMYLDGTGDYLSLTDSTNFDLGNAAASWCIEAWIYPTAFPNAAGYILSHVETAPPYTGWFLRVLTSTQLLEFYTADLAYILVSTGTQITTGSWQHVAVANDGANTRMFIDGTQVDTAAAGPVDDVAEPLEIGSYSDTGLAFQGYLDEVRITKGAARYTGAFTPTPRPFWP